MSSPPPEPGSVPAPAEPRAGQLRLRVLTFVILVAGGCGAAVWWLNSRTDTTDARDDALRSAGQGRFAEAEPALKRALAQRPDDAPVAEALARGHLEANNLAEAELYLTRWVDLRPTDPNPLRLRFDHYRKQKDREKAFADGLRLLTIENTGSPARKAAYVELRRTVMNLALSVGQYEHAEAQCRAVLAETPSDRGLRSMLANILRSRGDIAGAGVVLDKLLADHPDFASAKLARGINYLEAGAPEKAVPLLSEVFNSDRTVQRTAGHQLVIALERTGQAEEAKRVAAEVRKLQDVDTFGEAMKSQPDNLDIRVRLAERLLADGHTQDGLANLNAVLSIEPKNRAAHLTLASHYERQGQPAKAAEHRTLAGPTP